MESISTLTNLKSIVRSRTDIINQLVRLYGYKTYLEIGVRRKADNFDKVNCIYKVAVDPNQDCEYQMTSDQFFTLYDRKREFDLIFIDGLHTKDQSLRDIHNALSNLSPNGAIVVHDCNPTSEYLARPYSEYQRGGGPWNGSVWAAIAELRLERGDLEIFTFDIDHGTAVIRRGEQEVFLPSTAEYQLDYAFLDANRQPLLNLVKPDQFMELINTDTSYNGMPDDVKIDVVYTLGDGSKWEDNELRYSLRSLEKYFEDIGDVWIVGAKPPWLQNINHIPFPHNYRSNKDANLISAMIRVCLEKELSTNFVFMNDDQCLLSPMKKEDFKPYYIRDLSKTVEWEETRWQRRLKRTFEKLQSENKPGYHLDAHIPYMYDKTNFPEVMLNYDYGTDNGYTINTLYLNNCLKESELDPALQVNSVRAAFGKSLDDESAIRDIMTGKKFLMYNDVGLTPSLKKIMVDLFPIPSKFEAR